MSKRDVTAPPDTTVETLRPERWPLDLVAEHLACDSLSPKAVRWLLKQGVPASAILADDIPMLCREVVLDGRRFEFACHRPSEDAVPAFVFPVFDQYGDNSDLAAWHPTEGVALWLGTVAMLGEEQVDPTLRDEPLEVHASVLAWLRADRQGVVVLDQRRAKTMLREAGLLLVNDEGFAAKLHDALTIKAPQILVRAA